MAIPSLADMLLDDQRGGLCRVNRQAYTDPTILAPEHERVLERTWLYAGPTGSCRSASVLSVGYAQDILTPNIRRYEHSLVQYNGSLKIRYRRAILDLEALQPHGKVSIIL